MNNCKHELVLKGFDGAFYHECTICGEQMDSAGYTTPKASEVKFDIHFEHPGGYIGDRDIKTGWTTKIAREASNYE